MYQGNFAGRIPGLSNYFSPDAGAAATYSRSGALKGVPFAGGSATGTLTKFNVPAGAELSRSPLGIRQFKLTPNQMSQLGKGVTVAGDDAAKLAAKGLGKYGARAVPFAGAALSLADAGMRIRDKDYTGAALAAASAIPGPVGLAALGGLAFKDVRSAMNAPQQVASTQAGGLNIGGSAQASEDGEGATSTRTGRVIGPKSIAALGADIANQAFAPRLADGTLTGNQDFAGRLPGDKGFDNRDVQIKGAFNNAMDSRFVQQAGENLGLPSDFKAQTKDALAALGKNFKGATADRDGIYKGISETAKNLTLDPKLAPVSGFIQQLTTDNPNVSDADRAKKFKIAGFDTPLTNETVADIVSGFQPDAEKFTGLSTQERGRIEGGGGNRIVSGKLTDIAREALIGDIGTGSNLGLAKGTPLSISNMLGAAGAIQKNLQDSGTLASKRTAEIGRLAGGKGDITTPSLIRGLIPRGIGGSGRGTTPSPLQIGPQIGPARTGGGSGFTPVQQPVQPVEEFIPPLLPTGQPQSGQSPTALADIAQQAYTSALRSYGIDPGFFARIRPRRFNTAKGTSFRKAFKRRYF